MVQRQSIVFQKVLDLLNNYENFMADLVHHTYVKPLCIFGVPLKYPNP